MLFLPFYSLYPIGQKMYHYFGAMTLSTDLGLKSGKLHQLNHFSPKCSLEFPSKSSISLAQFTQVHIIIAFAWELFHVHTEYIYVHFPFFLISPKCATFYGKCTVFSAPFTRKGLQNVGRPIDYRYSVIAYHIFCYVSSY